jgi:antimicrobial peptide system SdpB family protein
MMNEPWTRSLGWARTLLALGTLLTLVFNDISTLFGTPDGLLHDKHAISWFASANLFVLGSMHLEWARWLAVLILAVTASGWRPRITAFPHWWITWSLWTACIPVDGGDQLGAVLTLLLLPVALTDTRKSHWQHTVSHIRAVWQIRFASVAVILCRVQVAAVYFHAAIGKLGVEEWRDGTAVWYWFLDPAIGAPRWAHDVLAKALANPWIVVGITWGTIALELLLAAALFYSMRYRKQLFPCALLFHVGIVLVHGLASFAFAMAAALVLLLVHPDDLVRMSDAGMWARFKNRWMSITNRFVPVSASHERTCRP